jgi:hypothetical protein
MAIDQLLCLLESFSVIGALDDFGWARDMALSVNKIDAIRGHKTHSLHDRRERYRALSHRRLARSRVGDALM